jgi:hypothetical protein
MNVRILVSLYGQFAAALGTLVLLVLPLAPWVRVPGWAYVYVLPVVAVAYSVFRTASEKPPTLEQLHLEIRRREAAARERAMAETSHRPSRTTASSETAR